MHGNMSFAKRFGKYRLLIFQNGFQKVHQDILRTDGELKWIILLEITYLQKVKNQLIK